MIAVQRLMQFVRGALAAGLVGSLILSASLLVGPTPPTSLPVLIAVVVVAALGGVVFGLIPNTNTRSQLAGCVVVGAAALGAGWVNGFGLIDSSLLLGSVLAAVVVHFEPSWPRWLSPTVVGLIVIVVCLANLVPLVLDGGGLNHDESAYALKAKYWIDGTPQTGWNLHRGIAMSGYGYMVFELGGSEPGLRAWGLIALAGLAAATWVLGRQIGGKLVGPLSAMAIMASPTLLRRSTEFLSDVPSSALLVACVVIVWREFARKEVPTYSLLWLLPFAWAAFYLRYQSVLSFALIAITVAVLFGRKALQGWRPVVLTAALGLLGLVPHFWYAMSLTESPLGILFWTADVAGREFYGEGLVDYFLLMGWHLAALIGPLAAIFFIWWLLKGWEDLAQRVKGLFLMIPVVGQVLALGILSHGEARFIFFPLVLTIVGGIAGFFYVSRTWTSDWRRATSTALLVLLAGSIGLAATSARKAVDVRSRETATILTAADTFREMSRDRSCGVMTSYQPQITFYSECITAPFRPWLEPDEALSRFEGDDKYLLVVEDGKRQPTGLDLDALVSATDGAVIPIDAEHPSADVYVFVGG